MQAATDAIANAGIAIMHHPSRRASGPTISRRAETRKREDQTALIPRMTDAASKMKNRLIRIGVLRQLNGCGSHRT